MHHVQQLARKEVRVASGRTETWGAQEPAGGTDSANNLMIIQQVVPSSSLARGEYFASVR